MSKSGATSLELDITFRFAPDGCAPNLSSVCVDGKRLPEHVSTVLWRYLADLAIADRVIDECWSNAEDETDDAECDEARMPGTAAE